MHVFVSVFNISKIFSECKKTLLSSTVLAEKLLKITSFSYAALSYYRSIEIAPD